MLRLTCCSAISVPGRSPMASLCPLGTAMDSPSQVQCCTQLQITRESRETDGNKKKTPNVCWVFSFWDPAVTYSPGRSARASLRPLDAARAEPSQVQCCTLTGIAGNKTFVDWIIIIPRRSRGFFFNGHSPMLLATCHVTLVRSSTCISLLLAARKRA